ncbi:hypothetical protein [Ktedonospora formicarum]|uniref:hypothetical protein n=1 Tax=Ktedonospora formicarum TaxID=2778364 RepID=UPI001C68B5B9|nr:hypothetical protein [Ktedonospora formicarum]
MPCFLVVLLPTHPMASVLRRVPLERDDVDHVACLEGDRVALGSDAITHQLGHVSRDVRVVGVTGRADDAEGLRPVQADDLVVELPQGHALRSADGEILGQMELAVLPRRATADVVGHDGLPVVGTDKLDLALEAVIRLRFFAACARAESSACRAVHHTRS